MKNPALFVLFSFICVCILCALGVWQLQRLAWKNDLIAKLDAAYDQDESRPLNAAAVKPGEYIYGSVEGFFMPDKALLLGPKTRSGKIGYDLVVPLELMGEHGNETLLVNMGWTAHDIKSLQIHHLNRVSIRFEGLALVPSWNSFTPDNAPEEEVWFKPDIQGIASARALQNPLPFMMYAEKASQAFGGEFPNNEQVYPNNNHLQYALFWFTMAGVLVLIAGIYIFSRRSTPNF